MPLLWDTPPCIDLLHDSPAPAPIVRGSTGDRWHFWQRQSTPTISSSYGRCSHLVVPFLTWLKRSPMKNCLKRELAIFYMLTSFNEVLGLNFQKSNIPKPRMSFLAHLGQHVQHTLLGVSPQIRHPPVRGEWSLQPNHPASRWGLICLIFFTGTHLEDFSCDELGCFRK